jgi:hypothetical protein
MPSAFMVMRALGPEVLAKLISVRGTPRDLRNGK